MKKNVLKFFLHSCLLASGLALLASSYMGLAYWRDPLHLFHAPKGELYLHDNMRIQAAGIINTMEFDSIILGTSVLENSSSADLEKALGGDFVNLSLSGSNFMERAIVLEHALKKKKIRRVFYSLDRAILTCPVSYYYPSRFWTYLYDDSQMNDLKAYTATRYAKEVLFGIPSGKKRSLDRPNEWMSYPQHACRFGGLHNWVANLDKQGVDEFLKETLPRSAASADKAPLTADRKRNDDAAAYVEKYVLSFAEKNRDMELFLVFPPYWRYYFADMRQNDPTLFSAHQHVIRYIVTRAAELGNVHVFGFEDCSFVDDIANYKDVTHYSDRINEYMAESAGRREHLLTPENVEGYLSRCEELAREFDIRALNEQAQKMLAEKER